MGVDAQVVSTAEDPSQGKASARCVNRSDHVLLANIEIAHENIPVSTESMHSWLAQAGKAVLHLPRGLHANSHAGQTPNRSMTRKKHTITDLMLATAVTAQPTYLLLSEGLAYANESNCSISYLLETLAAYRLVC